MAITNTTIDTVFQEALLAAQKKDIIPSFHKETLQSHKMLARAVRIFGSPKIYEIMSYLKWNNGSPVTYSRYKLSGCTYVRYCKTADSLSHNLI